MKEQPTAAPALIQARFTKCLVDANATTTTSSTTTFSASPRLRQSHSSRMRTAMMMTRSNSGIKRPGSPMTRN